MIVCYVRKKLVREKEKAVELRKKGFSYKEIMKEIPVAKSSLSLWLKDLPLTQDEKEVLKKRKNFNISKGRTKAASELRKRRLEREKVWLSEAKGVFYEYADDPRFHAGIVMYWAEGSKTSNRWSIINTDVEVIEMMVSWLQKYLDIPSESIRFRLYIHRPYADSRCEEWWQKRLKVSRNVFLKTIYKETQHKTKKKPSHKGCLRIEVVKSKKMFWMMKVFRNLAVEYYRKQ